MGPFFVRRPTVAIVISILLVLVGAAAFKALPVEQYPAVSPPTIRVETTYPGAGAEVVEESVATPLEQQINGVDNMLYMKSLNTSDGRMLLDVTFQVGMDLDMANVLTQNRVSQAQARLPQEVTQQGVTVKKINPSILMIVSLYSPRDTYDSLFLSNYAMINLRDNMLRVKGVSSVDLLGGFEYGMRVWFNPDRLAELGLQPSDVTNAIKEQNLQAPAGQIGAAPSPPGQQQTYTVRPPSRLSTPEEFGEILVRTSAEGAQVRLKDVASIELGSEFYKSFGRIGIPRPQTGQTSVKGASAAMLMVYLLPGANQLESAEGLYHALRELRSKKTWPDDLEYTIVYDTTPAVEASLESILHTFIEALVLVVLVVFVFLQNVRATIIPLITIPVSIVGTFVFFPMVGFSVNTLSMFGLILAIGIVVDDAIVVVEAVMHHIEHGMQPREATLKALEEVTAPVIGIALILTAVFIPVGFLGGLTGSLYKQFAITIAISVLISAFNALSLTPALCAMFLRAPNAEKGFLGKLLTPVSAFFGLGGKAFNKVFGVATTGYVGVARILIRRSILALVVVGVAGVAAVGMAKKLPGGFVPEEDQGIFMINCQLPAAASQQRTDELTRWIEDAIWDVPGIEAFNTIGGMSFLTNSFADNVASFAVKLRPWAERKSESLHANGVLTEIRKRLAQAPEGVAFPFMPPTLPGFGAAGGVSFLLQDTGGLMPSTELGEAADKFLAAARERPEIASPFTSFDPKVPQVAVELDREMARTLGVPVSSVFAALQTALGSSYVNDFNKFGRLYRVKVQAEPSARQRSEDIGRIKVRSNTTGQMVPLASLVKVQENSPGTEMTVRFNLLRSVEMSAMVKPGYSSGQAMAALEAVAKEHLPPTMGIAWQGLSFQEKTAPPSGPTMILAVVFVFLLLAAMYESWGLPFSVLLGTPFVAVGAFLGVTMGGFANDVFVQIGLVMLIGLAAKNSILIVEFAKAKRDAGATAVDAAIESARLRFRPILMTAFAFILGVVPLVLATGSGAASRKVMGTAVFWGMLVATVLGVLVTPALYTFMAWFDRKKKAPPTGSEAAPPHHDASSAGGH